MMRQIKTQIINKENRMTSVCKQILKKPSFNKTNVALNWVRNSKRRAISDVIVTLLLISITIVSGVLVLAFTRDIGVVENVETSFEKSAISIGKVDMIGYDARDGTGLSGITDLDNTPDSSLERGVDCIVLEIRHDKNDVFLLERINVNEVSHTWDEVRTGTVSACSDITAGTFTIVEQTTATKIDAQLERDQVARVIVGLSTDIDSDIPLGDTIRIGIVYLGNLDNFIIESGAAQ